MTGTLWRREGYSAKQNDQCEQALTDAANSVTLHDARGAEHRTLSTLNSGRKGENRAATRALTGDQLTFGLSFVRNLRVQGPADAPAIKRKP